MEHEIPWLRKWVARKIWNIFFWFSTTFWVSYNKSYLERHPTPMIVTDLRKFTLFQRKTHFLKLFLILSQNLKICNSIRRQYVQMLFVCCLLLLGICWRIGIKMFRLFFQPIPKIRISWLFIKTIWMSITWSKLSFAKKARKRSIGFFHGLFFLIPNLPAKPFIHSSKMLSVRTYLQKQ